MKRMKMAAILVMVVAFALVLGGCGVGSYQARSLDVNESPLVNPDILEKGADDQALYRYVNPKANFKQYNKIIIDPVLVNKDGELDKKELENYQKLANNAYVYLVEGTGKGLQDCEVSGTRRTANPDGYYRRRQHKAGPQYPLDHNADRHGCLFSKI